MNLYDIMRSAGGGDLFSVLARQYGMSEEEVRKAAEVFLPAFSAGLKGKTSDPFGLTEFLRRLASADYLRAYSSPEWATGGGRARGEEALRFMFGGPEAWRALVNQAGAFSGIPEAKLGELFPSLAAVMFGGLAKEAAAANPMLAAMLKQFESGASGASHPKGPLDRYEEAEAERDRRPADELVRAQGEMMRAGLSAFKAGTAAWQKAMGEAITSAQHGKDGRPEAQASGRDVFGDMFEPGLRLSQAYQREMEALLERLRSETSRS